MNSSSLRRLAADHALLRSTELPPYYLFPPSSADSTVDDLTQLNVLITGPTGTPYSQGLWRLSLKIPESYPKAPPKATFRTRIWHPNVDENTGSVCVDTLKKDWQPKLTLRDVLITIYCLLIQPNPDSALNATAGHLLQDDYDSFARQARLMTSIHATIPSAMKSEVLAAKKRGETAGTAGTAIGEDVEQSPTAKGKSASSSSSTVKRKLPEPIIGIQSAPNSPHQALEGEDPASEDEDDESASKENDPLLSPSPVLRRPALAKRPLSDLPIVELEYDGTDAPCLGSSEQNVVNNVNPFAGIGASDSSRKSLQSAERAQSVNLSSRGLQETGGNGMGSVDSEGRPTKRICSDPGKENTLENWGAGKFLEKPLPAVGAGTKVVMPASRKAPASSLGTSGVKGKSRVGLRRL